MQDMLSALFCDNPRLAEQTCAFLNRSPEFCRAEADYRQAMEELERAAGPELRPLLLRYEEAGNRVGAMLAEGYYLFGLGLGRTLREALWETML